MRLLTLTLVAGLLTACAHSPQKNSAGGKSSSGKDMSSFHLSDPSGPEIVDRELEYIPTEVNPMVDKWINYFQGRGRRHMERYLARSTRYEKLMKKVLRENGLPEDLFYIALIESGFSSQAVSHASAVGYWQFIRGTGKRYGLEISRLVDERRDPVLATQAAADYFRGLYSAFGSWYLAMASYNVGEHRVKREVVKHETRDFWELARKNRFPKETLNYVPKFIAGKMIAKNPAKYGFDEIDYLDPIEFDTVQITQPVNLRQMAEKMNLNYEDFKALNPKFKGEIAPLKNGSLDLRIPPGQTELALRAATESATDKIEYVADANAQAYRIRRGDTLSTIARRYRTTIAYLRDLNDIPKGRRLKVGSIIYVPDRTPLKERAGRTASSSSERSVSTKSVAGGPVTEGSARYHIVQSGDSLFTIARRYGTTIQELSKINKISRGRVLRVGARLKLPSDGSPGETTETPTSGPSTRSENRQGGARKKPARVHVVKRGESLIRIAKKYDVRVDELKKKNRIRDPALLKAGAKLLIPPVMAQR